MSGLPKGWTTSNLPKLISLDGVISDGDWIESKDQDPNGNIRLIQLADIGDGKFLDKSSRYMNEDKASILRCTSLEEGDVLIARMPDPLGRACIFPKIDSKAVTVVDICLVRVGSRAGVSNHLLKYWFNSPIIRNQIAMLATGTTRKRITRKKLTELELPVPPYNEQIRIANKLDSILAKVDKAQARLDKIPAILKRFRQSVLAAATSGELTKEWRDENTPIKHSEVTGKYELDWSIVEELALPESWQWVPLGNYAKCSRGKFSIRPRNDPSCFDGDYPFIQIGDLPRQGGFIYSHKQTLNEKGYSVSREFDAGTVVLAIVGATIANTGITTYPVCFPDSLVGINSASETTNKYLDYHLRAIKEDIRQASYAGGGQPNIKLTMVNPLPLPLPSEAEIVEIVAKVESLMARANKVEKQYLDAKARLDRLTQSILAKAFRGELVPQDPNDEPAEKLLERILAEKEQNKPKKVTRKRTTKAKTTEKV